MDKCSPLEAPTPPKSGNPPLGSWRLGVVITSLCLGIFLLGLDQNIIGVAIPRITTEFRSLNDIAWYGSAYLLTITAFQPFFGNLYKYFNAKLVYLVSLVLFEVGSIICAVANKSSVLIFGRAFLGFGAAGLLQGALAIIGNVPVGVAVVAAILLFVNIKPSSNQINHELPLRTKLQQMDAVGTLLFLGAVVSLLLVLQWGGQTYPWSDSRCIGLFVGFGSIAAVFGFWEWKQGDTAIVPFRTLRKRSIHMGALVLFALGMSSLTYAYYLPVYFQSAQGVSTTQSGVQFIALVLPQIVGLVVVGAIVTQWGYYVPYMVAGVVVTSIGAGLLTTIGVSTPTVQWAAYMVINGLGIGMAQQLPYTAVQAVLDPIDVPIGNAIAVFSYQLGGAIAVAIGQNLLLAKLTMTVPRHTNAVTPQAVIAVGATGLEQLAPTPEVLAALRSAYAEALRDPLILALASALLAFPFCCAMERLNIKHIAEKRQQRQAAMDEDKAEAGGKPLSPNREFQDHESNDIRERSAGTN
ncbi:hypothetical protein NUW58_g43 [Xylaria curta]|uniref:Uncharacterized protein n=1 Tax=Xylaria curta TaxID=42375 RepID=A0ACC1PSG4_9PEZI|nr:hypothetical protein NUW58_g43 [Xylaria curta]